MANAIKGADRRRQKLQFEVSDLSGGFVSQHSSYNVQEKFLEDIQNMELVQGMWQKRKGYSMYGQYSALSQTPGTVRGAHLFHKQDKLDVIVVSGETMFVASSLTGPLNYKVFNGSVPHSPYISFVDFRDDCYIAHGQGGLIKYDGNKLETMHSPRGNIVTVYDNRLVISGIKSDRLVLYYSEKGRGHEWDDLSYIALDGTSSEEITALIPALGKLYVFTNQNIYSLVGGLEDFALSLEVAGVGAVSPNSIKMINNRFYFVGQDYLIYEYDGGNFPENISVNISYYIKTQTVKNALKNVRIAEYENSIFFTVDNTPNRAERLTLVYFPDYGAWSKYKGIPAAEFLTIDDSLYFVASDNIGGIYRYGTQYSDEVYAIDAYLKTTKWSFDHLENIKRFKKLYVRGAIQSGGGNGFDVDFLIDDTQVASIRLTSNIASDTEIWGDKEWGEMFFGDAMETAGTAWGQFSWNSSDWGGSNPVFSPRWGSAVWTQFDWGSRRDGELTDDVGKIYSKVFLSQYNVISGKYIQLVFRDATPNHGFRLENLLLEYVQKGAR